MKGIRYLSIALVALAALASPVLSQEKPQVFSLPAGAYPHDVAPAQTAKYGTRRSATARSASWTRRPDRAVK